MTDILHMRKMRLKEVIKSTWDHTVGRVGIQADGRSSQCPPVPSCATQAA